MTAPDVDIPQLLNTLAGIHQRAPWAHSLAYDRPGRSLDPDSSWVTGSGIDTDRAPVGRWDDKGSITSIADTAMGENWHTMLTELRRANHDLTVALRRLRGHRILDTALDQLPLGTPAQPRRHPTTRHVHQACEDITRLLRPMCSWRNMPPAFANELATIAAMIHKADDQFPAIEYDPPRPLMCRDPRDNRNEKGDSACLGRVKHYGRQLCESCLKLEDDIAAERARQRRAVKDPACEEPGCEARRIARGKCMGHYQRARRAGLLRQAAAGL